MTDLIDDQRSTPPTHRRQMRAASLGGASLGGASLGGAGLLVVAVATLAELAWPGHPRAFGPPGMPPPAVTVSVPLQRVVTPKTSFLGQFSAVNSVELRAQVGGFLTEIHVDDGQIVHQGDLLFVIDPRPYQIALEQAVAQFTTAKSQLDLAASELWRAQQLKRTEFGTAETLDQRVQQQSAAQSAVEQAKAAIHTAQLNLGFTRVTAPFSGRVSYRRVSVGDLIAGSITGGTTTLLTTLVSLNPIHLDFDMSENDFLTYQRFLHSGSAVDRGVDISLGDEEHWTRHGTLDFVDNAMDRGSGTIHARATVANPDLFIAPGEFARIRVRMSAPRPMLLLPDAAVTLDQSQQLAMTVAPDGTVVPKPVQVGEIEDGLRVITSGLAPHDRVIIDGLMRAIPGTKVNPEPGSIHASGPV